MKKQFIKFNVNHHVYVKLTDSGILKYINHYNRHSMSIPNFEPMTITELVKRVDEDGYYKFQMHEFMEVFGEDVTTSTDFDTNIFFDKDELSVPEMPLEVKAMEGWYGRSKTDEEVDVPDGYYDGVWGGYVVEIQHLKIKGKASSISFRTIEGIRCMQCPVKIIVKNKHAYIYDEKNWDFLKK